MATFMDGFKVGAGVTAGVLAVSTAASWLGYKLIPKKDKEFIESVISNPNEFTARWIPPED